MIGNNQPRPDEKPIWRMVAKSETYYVYGPHVSNARARTETLDHCGHKIYMKGSARTAKKRRCRECEGFRRGNRITTPDGVTVWDEELGRPYTYETA